MKDIEAYYYDVDRYNGWNDLPRYRTSYVSYEANHQRYVAVPELLSSPIILERLECDTCKYRFEY